MSKASEVAELPGLKVELKKLANVLFKDEEKTIKASGKWPLIIDEGGQASTFLRYRDTNCINALSKDDMEPNRIRMALIGSIRFGKPFVLDMMEADMFQVCIDKFDEIQKGLMDSILDSSILKDEKYMSLVKESDGEEYKPSNMFMVEEFIFVVVSSRPMPEDSLIKRTFPIRVVM